MRISDWSSDVCSSDLLEKIRLRGGELRRALESRFGNNPYVGDIRGRGLFLGIEMVADRGTKEPFDPARRLNAAIKREALSRGLMVYPMGGTIDGRRGDHVLVAPPFIIDQSHIGEIVEKLGDAVDRKSTRLNSSH